MADRPDAIDEAVARLTELDSVDPAHAPRDPDPVLDALSVAGSVVERPLRRPRPDRDRDVDTITAAVAASGWFAWRVRLTGRWWDALLGPLVVRSADGPATVVPGRDRAVLVDGDRRTRRVNRATAAGVDDDALALVTDLPTDTGWTGLLRWSLARQRTDRRLFVLLAAIGGVAGLLLPLATGAVFASAIPSGDTTRVAVILAGFAVASLGAAVVAVARGLAVVRMRDRTDALLSMGAMARLLRLRPGFFRGRSVGDVANRVASVETARQAVDDTVVSTVLTSVFGLASIGYLFVGGPGIAVVTLLAVAVVLAVAVAVQWRARSRSPALLEARSRADAILLSMLDTLVSWRVAGAEDRALARWAVEQQGSTAALRRRLAAVSWGAQPLEQAGPVLVLAVFTAAVVLVPSAALEPGSSTAPGVFVSMYAAVVQVMIALLMLISNVMTLSEYGPQLARLEPLLTAAEERTVDEEPPAVLTGAFDLVDVTFGYHRDRRPLFRGLTLTIPSGQFVALVGPSGSGKSTLLRLMLGFERPWDGCVEVDGRDLAVLDVAAVRRQLGVVLQGSQPLGRSVRECVAGPGDLDDDRVWRLLARVGLDDDVTAMPDGLDTPVGSRGSGLSGGQRQRLVLAAALAREPRALLLDEATSALDNVTQAVVMRTVLGLDVTRVVVAHRLTTVERADRVVVVADGTVVEDGPPADLLRAGGRFARLAARQGL